MCTEAVRSVGRSRDHRIGQEKQWNHSQQQSLPQKFRSRSSNVLNYEFKFKHLGQLKTSPCPKELHNMAQWSLEWHVTLLSAFRRKQHIGKKIVSIRV